LKKTAYQQQLPDDYWEKVEKTMTDMNMNQDKERLAQRRKMLKNRMMRKQRQQE